MKLDKDQQDALLQIAWQSLRHGLQYGRPLEPDLDALPDTLAEPAACFVTLHKGGLLRGCIGSMEASEPLAKAVAWAAFSAGFRDPRFPSLAQEEMDKLTLEISILSPMQDMPVSSEQDLLSTLRPGIDGLLLEEHWRHAVYLPSVWQQLPVPLDFVRQLKLKGGWPANYWSEDMRAKRFQSETIS